MIQGIVAFILLCAPTVWELISDRKGDLNKETDVFIRVGIMAGVSTDISHFTWAGFLVSFNLSAAIFFLFFDYAITYILIHNGTIELPRGSKQTWFSYTAKSGFVDRVPNWKDANPWLKLGIRVLYFTGSAILYFKANSLT